MGGCGRVVNNSIWSQIFGTPTMGEGGSKMCKHFSSDFLAISGNLEHFSVFPMQLIFLTPQYGAGRGVEHQKSCDSLQIKFTNVMYAYQVISQIGGAVQGSVTQHFVTVYFSILYGYDPKIQKKITIKKIITITFFSCSFFMIFR